MVDAFRDRVFVVTGASAGVGRATVRELARKGARIGLLARGRAGLEAARREIEELGGEGLAVPTDVADADAVERAAVKVEAQLGPIDVWINNAMVTVMSPVREMTAEEYRRVTEVTYLGYVHGTLSALRRMLARDAGVIIQVGSALAYRGIPGQSAYCAAKHAIQGFNDSLRVELAHEKRKVRVSSVHLPAVNTPQFLWAKNRMPRRTQPVPPIHQPEIAARGILRAVTDPRREIWVGWPTVKVIVGNRVAPWAADRSLARDGYEAQQLENEPEEAGRAHNLWGPVDDDIDAGAHGPFDDRSRGRTSQLWFSRRKRALLGGAAAVAATVLAAGLKWRSGDGNGRRE